MKIPESSRSFQLTIQRSRFYAVLAPVRDLDEVKALLARRRKAVKKANHHCWACRLIKPGGGFVEQARDDGEVGRPGLVLLQALQRRDLQAILVVSRIFGGIKLGAGGVSRAFRQAADGVIGTRAL